MADQAQNLRDLVRRNKHNAHVIAVTSGKGGVGKTNTSVNLAIALAALDKHVIVIDADLGLANVEVLMGLGSLYNLEHVIDGERTMADVLVRAPGGIQVVPGSSGLARVADLSAAARENVLNGLAQLQRAADFIILDTMAGIGRNAVTFAAAAHEVLLVTTPEPSAIVDAYAMLKTIYTLRDDAVVRLLVNMVGSPPQAQAVANKLANVSQAIPRTQPLLPRLRATRRARVPGGDAEPALCACLSQRTRVAACPTPREPPRSADPRRAATPELHKTLRPDLRHRQQRIGRRVGWGDP